MQYSRIHRVTRRSATRHPITALVQSTLVALRGLWRQFLPRSTAGDQMSNKIAFNPQDRFVMAVGNRIAVITQDGSVFGHEVSGHHSGEAFKFTGSKAA